MAINFLMLCSTGGADGVALALGAGVSGVNCAAGEIRVCTRSGEGSGLLVAWAVALGFNFMGIG